MDRVSSTANKLILEAAEEEKGEAMLASFRPEVLDYAFTVESEKKSSSHDQPDECASKVVVSLKRTLDSIEAFNRIRRDMDQGVFADLMKADNFFVTSGVDKEKGRKICFVRYGSLYKGIWSQKSGSPSANAIIAASLFQQYTAIENVRLGATGSELQMLHVLDFSESGCLDIKLDIQKAVVNLAKDLYCAADGVVLFAGIPTYGRFFVDYMLSRVPNRVTKNWKVLGDRDNIEQFVEKEDVPRWWYFKNGGEGVPHDPNDTRNAWIWEDCLAEESDLTVKDIFCPGPWLDGVGERIPRDSSRSQQLETFEEDGEEEEW